MSLQPIEQPDPEFERLIEINRAQLHGFVLSLVPNTNDAEDLLQHACLTFWEKRDQFERDTNFLAWARKIIRYQVLNYRRKEQNRPPHSQLVDEQLADMIEERTEEREREFLRHRRALQSCIEELADRQRVVIEARYFDGKSLSQIAAETSMKTNAVSQLLFRARNRLIQCVQSKSHRFLSGDDPELEEFAPE